MPDRNPIMTPFNNPLIKFVAEPRFRWLRHTLFILVGLVLAFKGDIGIPGDVRPPGLQRSILLLDGLTYLFIMGIIYLMTLVLIPRLLFRSRVFLFLLSMICVICMINLVVWLLDYYLLRPADPNHTIPHIELTLILFIQLGAVSTVLLGAVLGLVVFKKWVNDVQHMNELHQTNLKTELAQLKSQVNPHFLFNTLNNLFVLTKTDPEKASQVILGLSDLLRYQLYDSAKEKILLSKDIDFIHNLLALEKIRKNDFEYNIKTEGKIDGVGLPPFLFIPFVENAIKHGSSTVGHSYLNIHFRITEKQVHFTSVNSKPIVKNNSIGGLGLKNITRRLELLYPGKYILDTDNGADKYTVKLIIPL